MKLAAFDLDGTLLNSIPSIVVGVRTCWEVLGFPPITDDQIKNIIGLPWEESVERLMPGSGSREVKMIKEYHAEITRGERRPPNRPPEKVFPGVEKVLDQLQNNGYGLAIVTSRSNRRFKELLERGNLAHRFISMKTADQGPGKPDPYLLNEAMREIGVQPRDTVMIGDTTYDIQMGRNAGTGAVGVTWGVHVAKELRVAGAHQVVDVLEDLYGVIEATIRAATSR
tara:strand:+ start:167 stop:844 length:678 start_codon:yes stop_codon:yes gene_type:complete